MGERLRASGVRLLTLTGPGGVGKTRLAVEAARSVEADFAGGAHFVALDAVQHSDDVAPAIVKSLGIIVLAGESDSEAAARFLASKHLLLVTDNFEQVLAAAPFVGELLGACPGLTVLATSREPLALQAEHLHAVPPLRAMAAEALFAARAGAHDPAFELDEENASAVAEICRRVDGLPLAIELAAARCGLMSAGEIAQRLGLRARRDWGRALATRPRASGRCARPSTGATSCSTTRSERPSPASQSSPAARRWKRRRRSPAPISTRSTASWRRACSSAAAARAARRGSRCSRPSARMPAERFAAAADGEEVRRRHYSHYLEFAHLHATERAVWGASHREHLAVLDAESENLDGGSPMGDPRGRGAGPRAVRRARHLLAGPRSQRRRGRVDGPSSGSRGGRRPSRAARAPALRRGSFSVGGRTRGRAAGGYGRGRGHGDGAGRPGAALAGPSGSRYPRERARPARLGSPARCRRASVGGDRKGRMGDRDGRLRNGDGNLGSSRAARAR